MLAAWMVEEWYGLNLITIHVKRRMRPSTWAHPSVEPDYELYG
jgi:hypothetical protein